jgi:hypothetical protein
MKNEHQEDTTRRPPLILTVPAYCFVVALHLDCLGRSNQEAFSDETLARSEDELTRDVPRGITTSRFARAFSARRLLLFPFRRARQTSP